MKKIFVDTSGFIAVEDTGDQEHPKAIKLWQDLSTEPVGIYTTNFVFDETYTLLLAKVGRKAAIDFGTNLRESKVVQVVYIDEEFHNMAWNIALTYQDKDFSFTDCTSFAVMEQLGIKEAFTFDVHFKQYGFLPYHTF